MIFELLVELLVENIYQRQYFSTFSYSIFSDKSNHFCQIAPTFAGAFSELPNYPLKPYKMRVNQYVKERLVMYQIR
jgi:hypothetical protein